MELLSDPQAWLAFATLTALEIVLGIDNIIFISILVGRLPKNVQHGRPGEPIPLQLREMEQRLGRRLLQEREVRAGNEGNAMLVEGLMRE